MASTTQTTNYGLPIYQQSDKASWTDTNEGFEAIDTAVKSAVTDVESLSPIVAQNTSDIANLQSSMTSAQADIGVIKNTTIPTMQSEIDLAETATGTSYSNVNSGLSANTVQSAVDEIVDVQKGKLLAAVTSDGVTDFKTLLHTFYDALQNLTPNERSRTYILQHVNDTNSEDRIFRECDVLAPNDRTLFNYHVTGATSASSGSIYIASIAAGCQHNTAAYTTNGNTFTSNSDTVPAANYITWSLYIG